MTLESWSMGIARPIMEQYPYAWAFFVPFILTATFIMLNLFIAVIVNAVQTMHEQESKEIHDIEQATQQQILNQMQQLRHEIAQLRSEIKKPTE